jgi:hypothetical protein
MSGVKSSFIILLPDDETEGLKSKLNLFEGFSTFLKKFDALILDSFLYGINL